MYPKKTAGNQASGESQVPKYQDLLDSLKTLRWENKSINYIFSN